MAFVWNVGNHCWSHKSSRISLRRRFFYTTLLVIKELPVLESFFTICAKIFSSAINSCGKWQVTEFMRFFTLCTHLHSGQKCLKNTKHPGLEPRTFKFNYSKGIGLNPTWGKVFETWPKKLYFCPLCTLAIIKSVMYVKSTTFWFLTWNYKWID